MYARFVKGTSGWLMFTYTGIRSDVAMSLEWGYGCVSFETSVFGHESFRVIERWAGVNPKVFGKGESEYLWWRMGRWGCQRERRGSSATSHTPVSWVAVAAALTSRTHSVPRWCRPRTSRSQGRAVSSTGTQEVLCARVCQVQTSFIMGQCCSLCDLTRHLLTHPRRWHSSYPIDSYPNIRLSSARNHRRN